MEVMMAQDVLPRAFNRRGHNKDVPNFVPNKKPVAHTKKFSPKFNKNPPKSEEKRLTEKVNSGELKKGFILLKRGDPLDLKAPKVESSTPSRPPTPSSPNMKIPKLEVSTPSTTPSPPKSFKSPVKSKAKAAEFTSGRRNTRIRQEEPYVDKIFLKQIRMGPKLDSFAGSTVYTSPSPRSLPVPTFFMTPAKMDVMKMLNLD